MKKKIVTIMLAGLLSLSLTMPVFAATVSDIKKQQSETQKQLNNVNNTISGLKSEQSKIQAEMADIDDQLVEILTSVSLLEDEIAAKEEEIRIATEEYEAAKAEEEKQYEAMKTRIRFMYEKGDQSYLELFIQAESLGDLVNKADYIEKLYTYDRELLEEYQAIKEEVARAKEALEEEQAELEERKHQLEEEKAALDEVLNQKKKEAANYDTQIAKAKQEAAAYKAKIKQQNAEIKKLEEEARKKAASQNKGAGGSTSSIIQSSSGSASGKEIANYACKFIGNPYVYGGTSLTNGADCSGFVQSVYRDCGYSVPRTAGSQRGIGTEVSYGSAEPGDLFFYAGHVGIYIGGGQIVHASSAKTGIKISNATYREIVLIKRVV